MFVGNKDSGGILQTDPPGHEVESVVDSPVEQSKNQDNCTIDFLNDKPQHMTFGRRIALHLASKYSWYNPNLGKTHGPNGEELPSLAKAWAYFEHVTLQRYVVREQTRKDDLTTTERIVKKFHRGDRKLNIAKPGERDLPTKLYNPITTPLRQMGDFGLGYGLYFSTLRAFAVLSFVVGLLNLPNIIYFASDEYSINQNEISPPILQGTAVCTDQPWVPCPDCTTEYGYQAGAFSRWRNVNKRIAVNDSSGEWLNITHLLDWSVVDPNVTGDEIYYPEAGLFTQDVLAALEAEYGVVVDSDSMFTGYYDSNCSEMNSCLYDYCWCQLLSQHDCYCIVGKVAFANTNVFEMGFAQKNNCDGATTRNGYINMASVFLFSLGIFFIRTRQNRLEVEFDEDEQTAQDYSICISNPPPDAFDPEEWKEFFETNFHCQVAVCTVDVNNDYLVRLFVKRREILQDLRGALPGIELSHSYMQSAEMNKNPWCCQRSVITKLCRKYRSVVSEIQKQVARGQFYPTTAVFVTFETEAGQRKVLRKLSVGWNAWLWNNALHPRYRFRGKYILDVSEPEEPSAIRWQEMNVTRFRIVCGLVFTSFASLVILVMAYNIITFLYPRFPHVAPLVVTLFTLSFPIIAKALMNFERHQSESSRQKWLFIKIAIFNILITAGLISVVNDFTASLDQRQESIPGLIPAVHATFISQLGLTPLLQFLDIGGNLSRHVFAPRAKTQEAMNRYFGGTQVFLAERYANLMKYLFLMVWYCALYPIAFFMGACALLIVYFGDRFSLLRSWARTPQLGTQISDFARNYFTPVAVVVMAVSSAYAWSGFPFDNLCPLEGVTVDDSYVGEWYLQQSGLEQKMYGRPIFREPDVSINVTVANDAQIYQFCHQDFRSYIRANLRAFPPLPKFQLDPWMTMEQADLMNVYGWVAVGILAAVLAVFLIRNLYNCVKALMGSYSPRGRDMGIPFSQIDTIDTYIPSCPAKFGYPYVLCDVKSIDPKLFSWSDPDRPHQFYDVTQDLIELMGERSFEAQHLFAQVKHWHHGKKDHVGGTRQNLSED